MLLFLLFLFIFSFNFLVSVFSILFSYIYCSSVVVVFFRMNLSYIVLCLYIFSFFVYSLLCFFRPSILRFFYLFFIFYFPPPPLSSPFPSFLPSPLSWSRRSCLVPPDKRSNPLSSSPLGGHTTPSPIVTQNSTFPPPPHLPHLPDNIPKRSFNYIMNSS